MFSADPVRLSARDAFTPSLDDLKRRRSELGQRVARLNEVRDRLRQAETDEADALAAIGHLGRAEATAAKQWAAAGAVGDMPAINYETRADLTRRLAVAAAQAEAARSADADVEAKIAAASREGAQLASSIAAVARSALVEQFNGERAELDLLVTDVRMRTAATLGMIALLREQAAALQSADRLDEARPILVTLEGIVDMHLDVAPSVVEVTAATPAWAARYEELVR